MRGGKRLARPFLNISGRIAAGGERGLLSLAFAPDYRSSGRFYVYFTAKNGDIRIVEYRRAQRQPREHAQARARLLSVGAPGGQPQRRPRAVRPRRAALRRARRRRRRRATSTAAAATRRTSARCSARSAHRPAHAAAVPVPPEPVRGQRRARSTPTACATRGASRSRRSGNLVIGDVGQGEIEEIDIASQRGHELRLARVRGPQPLHARRVGARPRPAGHPALPLRQQLLDHRRRRGPRPGAVGAARALRVRRLLPRRHRVGAHQRHHGAPTCGRPRCTSTRCPRSGSTAAGACT